MGAPKYHFFLEKNDSLEWDFMQETNITLEKGEKNNLFSGKKYIAKRQGKAFIRPE